MSNDPQVVFVTGAASGLGLAIGRCLVHEGYRVVLTSRGGAEERFADAGLRPGDRVMVLDLDVADDGQRRTAIAAAEERFGRIDVLVNNAGISYRSVLEHLSDVERVMEMEINFRAPMELVRLVLPGMRARRNGHIINISSVGGMMAMPTMAMYSASKFALEGASEALWYEVRPFGIKVSLVEPGFIRSSSFQNVRMTQVSAAAAKEPSDPYYPHYHRMAPFIAGMMNRSPSTPARIARVLLKTMRKKDPPLRVPATFDAHVFGFLRRVLPRSVYHRVLYRNLPHVKEWGGS